jgi:hypothetical protein
MDGILLAPGANQAAAVIQQAHLQAGGAQVETQEYGVMGAHLVSPPLSQLRPFQEIEFLKCPWRRPEILWSA